MPGDRTICKIFVQYKSNRIRFAFIASTSIHLCPRAAHPFPAPLTYTRPASYSTVIKFPPILHLTTYTYARVVCSHLCSTGSDPVSSTYPTPSHIQLSLYRGYHNILSNVHIFKTQVKGNSSLSIFWVSWFQEFGFDPKGGKCDWGSVVESDPNRPSGDPRGSLPATPVSWSQKCEKSTRGESAALFGAQCIFLGTKKRDRSTSLGIGLNWREKFLGC